MFGIRALWLAPLLWLAQAAHAGVVWDLPTAYPANNFHTGNLQRMADQVAAATKGEFRIRLYPNGSLYKAGEIKAAVQSGKVPLGEMLMSTLSAENIIFAVDSVPFLATSYDDARRLWRASKPVMGRVLDRQGMLLAYAVPWPPQGIYVKRPVDSADDMKGLKWRAYNRATTRMGELFGAHAVNVSAADLSEALAAGRVEAFLSSSATGVDVRAWEHLGYFYTVNAWLPKNMVIVNRRAFDALEPRFQRALLQALEEAEQRGWQVSEQKNEGYLKTLAQNGMRIGAPSAKWRGDLNRVGRALIAEWLQEAVSVRNEDGKIIFSNYLRGASDDR